MLHLLITTGLRRGELLGLKWSDIDFENLTVEVQRNITYSKAQGIVVDTTKTAKSKRTVPLISSTEELLKAYRA